MSFLPSDAYGGGLDFQHNWKERTWYVAGNAEFSHIKGDEEAITNLQRSSARYFQRPDADYLSVDSSATSLSGFGANIKFGRGSQKKLQFESSLTLRSPGLEFNDVGYMRYSDVIHHATWVAYYLRNPFFIFNNFYLNTNYWMYFNFSGEILSFLTNMNFSTQFKNRWNVYGSFTGESKSTSTTFLRGGPSFINPGSVGFNLELVTDQSKKITLYAGNYQSIGYEKSIRYQEYWGGFRIRPMNSMSITLAPEYSIQDKKLQYVTTTSANGNLKYLFGELDMKTLSFVLRINYTITPELTIEYYGQPFVSAGNYSDYKIITYPKADEYTDRFHVFEPSEISFDQQNNLYAVDEDTDGIDDFTFGNPDFNFRQFRSNLVVRWEYLPGSVLYLVWSQGRTSSAPNGVFSYGSDMKDLFDIVPHDIFLVKFSYWFAL